VTLGAAAEKPDPSPGPDTGTDLLALDEALGELSRLDERQARIVELRYFGGLAIEETALVLDISPATVKREWTLAKAWLSRRIRKGRRS
jgi:RNA polymerase sigma factor (sigma-70 family)